MKEVLRTWEVDHDIALVFQFAEKDKTRAEVLRQCEEVFHAHGLQTHVVHDAVAGSKKEKDKKTTLSFLLLHVPFKKAALRAQREQSMVELHNGLFDCFHISRLHAYKHGSDTSKLFYPSLVHNILTDILNAATGPREGIAVVTDKGSPDP
mmetsp:Transcript_29598/g.49757  ORF Transcript_29598/g.49757 Transcript_29598/m.49757 type:complete len:151 (+) Transcript_29598:129-581(+)